MTKILETLLIDQLEKKYSSSKQFKNKTMVGGGGLQPDAGDVMKVYIIWKEL
jgi:hypothetical protein